MNRPSPANSTATVSTIDHQDRIMTADRFLKPNTTITAVDLAFPARGIDPNFLPPRDMIPDEYEDRGAWVRFHDLLFLTGLPEDVELYPREGIDPQQAWDHLRVVQGCFGSKHEHKMDALAWLSHLWFEAYRIPSAHLQSSAFTS